MVNKKKRVKDLEILIKNNPEVSNNSKAVKFLINEYISSGDIKSGCEKVNFIDQKVKNYYLDQFIIYCLINKNQKDEAQLIFDLLKEKGFNDKFFEDKINFLLGITEKTSQKIKDDNIFNFFLSHITSSNFQYEPNEKTSKLIWRYLSSFSLIQINNIDDENIITSYEQAASQDSFDDEEIFKML